MYRLLLIASPSRATTALRSTSVSKTMPRSAPLLVTIREAACIAALFSGFGMWLGNRPSPSKNWLPARRGGFHSKVCNNKVKSMRSLHLCQQPLPSVI